MHNPGASHSGGSCQVAFSYDKGETWVVVHTWEGNCPRVENPGTITNVYDVNQDYTFLIPESFPTGNRVIFAWYVVWFPSVFARVYGDRVWINASGNREYYMSCSSVDIIGTGCETQTTPPGPPLFIANLDPLRGECYTKEQTSLIYPKKYVENTPIERAPVGLQLQEFAARNPDSCGSDNQLFRKLVGGIAGEFT